MAAKHGKSAYDEDLSDARMMIEGVTDEADISLEEILAEYGGSRGQKLLSEVEQAVIPARNVSDEPLRQTESVQETGEPAKDLAEQTAAQNGAPSAPTEAPPPQPMAAQRSDKPSASPVAEEATLPKAPRPIPMEEVVGRTVDAVMEEQELLPEKKQRRGLFSRRQMVETEELYQRTEQPPQEQPQEIEEQEEPIGPEEPLDEAAADARRERIRLKKRLPAAVVMTALVTALMVADREGFTLPYWSQSVEIQSAVLLCALIGTAIACRSVFVRGFQMLLRKRCTGELAVTLATLLVALDCGSRPFLTERAQAMPYVLTACAAMTFALWGGVRRQRAMYDTCRAASVTEQPPYLVTDTPSGACKQAGRIEGFYWDTVQDEGAVRWESALLPVILMGSLVFAGLSSLGQGQPHNFLLCWSATLSASASLALPLVWSLPWSALARQLQKSSCAVAGWAGADKISRKRTMIVTDADLFPPGTVRLNGIKLYGEEMVRAVSCAASLVRASGSGLERLFDGLVRSENAAYLPLDDFSFYEEGGFSANCQGEHLLLGTASFMRKMDIRLPGNINLRTGVFLAVDGQLTAVFAVKYSAAENVDWALRMLRRNRITPILASRDPNITPALLQRKFSRGVRVDYPALAARLALSEQEEGKGRPRALLLRDGLLPYAETVIGSRRLCRASQDCACLALLGSGAGMLLTGYLAFLGSFSLMPPLTMLVFLLLWTAPVVLLSGWAGRF